MYKSRGSEQSITTFLATGSDGISAKSIPFSDPPAFEYRNESLQVPQIGGYTTSLQEIAYENGRDKFNSCTHVKYNPFHTARVIDLGSAKVVPQSYLNDWTLVERRAGQLDLGLYDLFPSIPSPSFSSVPWTAMKDALGDKVRGEIPSQVEMLTNLFQLSQTVAMLKHPWRLIKRARTWKRYLKGLTASEVIKTGAGLWLEKRYGWDNFHRDIVGVAHMFDKLQSHIAYLEESAGKYASCAEKHTDVYSYDVSPSQGNGGGANCTVSVSSRPVKAYRTAAVSLDVKRAPYVRTFLGTSKLMNQYLGFDNVLQTLWDLLPFSFVVDWFFDLSGISQLSPMEFQAANIRQLGYSIKTTIVGSLNVTSTVWVDGETTTTEKALPEIPILEQYERHPGFPQGDPTEWVGKGLNLLHTADAAALIVRLSMR